MKRVALFLAILLLPSCASAQRVGVLGGNVPIVVVVNPPATPNTPSPVNGAVSVALTPTLTCVSSNAPTYTISFGTDTPPTNIANGVSTGSNCSYSTAMDPGVTYYWRVTATNANSSATGPIWSFTTASSGGDIAAASANCADSAQNSPTGRNPRLLWTCARQAVWNQMRTDYDANPSSPATLGGKWFKEMRTRATSVYGTYDADIGQWNAIVYQMTGDADYITNPTTGAWVKMQSGYLSFPDGIAQGLSTSDSWVSIGWDPNVSRIWNSQHIVWLEWMWPVLSGAQRAQLRDKIIRDQRHAFDYYGFPNFPLGDSDQISGQFYWPTALLAQLFPTSTPVLSLWNDSRVGGLTATAANVSSTARNAIKHFFADAGVGGNWIESGEYDKVTIPYQILGTEAIKTATGVDYFPEATAWYPDFAKQMLAHITPDLNKYVQWGDEENPKVFQQFRITGIESALAGLLQGTTVGQQVQQHMLDLITKYGATGANSMGTWNTDPLGIILFNPYATAIDWKTSKSWYASGIGVGILRSGWATTDSLFWVHTASLLDDPVLGSFMADHHNDYLGNFQLYKNGEWILTHPMGYAGAVSTNGEGGNTMMSNGLTPWEYKKTQDANYADTHFYLAMVAGGSNVELNWTGIGQPAVNTHEMTRDILYVPGTTDTVIIHDRLNNEVVDATNRAKFNYFSCAQRGYFLDNKHARQEWIFHTQVDPTFASGAYTWTTPDTAQKVKWTPLLPASPTRTVYDDIDDFVNGGRCGWGGSGLNAIYRTDHDGYNWKTVKIWPSSIGTFHTYLNVFGVHGTVTPATPELIQDSGKAECAHVVNSGQNDLLACFNATASGTLNTTSWDASHAAALAVVRYRSTGFTITYTATATTTEWYVCDLDPTKTWTYTKDGGAPVTLSKDSGGFVRTTLSGAGAHTLVVTGS